MIGLGGDGKRILAYTAREANRLRDYWIETEHLVLGILRERENAAAVKLGVAGLDLERSRQLLGVIVAVKLLGFGGAR